MKRHQIVVCIGPRCTARRDPTRLLARAEQRIEADPALAERLSLGVYRCLSRCPAGPNVLVRTAADGEQTAWEPGWRELNNAAHYWAVTDGMLDRIIDEHCLGDGPIAGRQQPY